MGLYLGKKKVALVFKKEVSGSDAGGVVATEDITLTPTTSEQVVKRSTGKYINQVTVGAIQTEEKIATENGEVVPSDGKFLTKVLIDVETPAPNLQKGSANENGVYTPDEGYDGFSEFAVNVGGDKKIVLKNIPNELNTTASSFYVFLNEDELLYSIKSGSSTNHSGIWHYRVSTSEWTQLTNNRNSYQYFYQVSETKWIVAAERWATYIYDYSTNTVKELLTTGIYGIEKINEDKWLLITYNGKIVVYYVADDSYKEFTGGYFAGALQLTETKWVITKYGSNEGYLTIYNSENDTVTQFQDIGKIAVQDVIHMDGNKWVIPNMGSSSFGVVIYNSDDDTAVKVYEKSYWRYYLKVSDTKVLFGSNNSSYKGLWVLNTLDNSFTQVYDINYNWINLNQITTGKVLVSSTSYNGILLYNVADDSVTEVYTTNREWTVVCKLSETQFAMAVPNGAGFIIFNSEDNTFSQPTTSASWWIWYQLSETEWCATSKLSETSNRGIYYYNLETNTNKTLISSIPAGVDYSIIKEEDGTIYFVGTKNEFKWIFDKTNITCTLLELAVEG